MKKIYFITGQALNPQFESETLAVVKEYPASFNEGDNVRFDNKRYKIIRREHILDGEAPGLYITCQLTRDFTLEEHGELEEVATV